MNFSYFSFLFCKDKKFFYYSEITVIYSSTMINFPLFIIVMYGYVSSTIQPRSQVVHILFPREDMCGVACKGKMNLKNGGFVVRLQRALVRRNFTWDQTSVALTSSSEYNSVSYHIKLSMQYFFWLIHVPSRSTNLQLTSIFRASFGARDSQEHMICIWNLQSYKNSKFSKISSVASRCNTWKIQEFQKRSDRFFQRET